MAHALNRIEHAYRRMVDVRRLLHAHPELAFEEARTAEIVIAELGRLGIEYSYAGVGSAIVGRLAGDREGPTVALRAEMDALPGHENTDLPFSSSVEGRMHACGHDVHMAMAVLPASCFLDTAKLRDALNAREVELVDEDHFRDRFVGCDPGAMPPFGHLYDMPVYVDERLTHDDAIVFNAGTHTELIRIHYADFDRLEHPRVLRFGVESSPASRAWSD